MRSDAIVHPCDRSRALLVGIALSCMALGCGGPSNLGDNWETWFDGNATDPSATSRPTTIYEGPTANFAVDEGTLYVTMTHRTTMSKSTMFWKSCDLTNCAATVHALHRRSRVANAKGELPPDSNLATGGAEIFFTALDGWDRPAIQACPGTGCIQAPRTVVRTPGGGHLLATNDDVFWVDGDRFMRCARSGCASPDARSIETITRSGGVATATAPFAIAGSYAYLHGPLVLARIKLDLSEDPETLYASEVPIRGVAVAGSWVYFGISTLIGDISRCPITGCVGDPETIVSGERWPSSIVADEQNVYWFASPGGADALVSRELRAASVDGSSAAKTLAAGATVSPDTLRMNSHHLYWADRGERKFQIRTIAK